VPQRHKDIRKAKELMAAAGYAKGFAIELTTEKVGEILSSLRSSRRRSSRSDPDVVEDPYGTAYFAGTQTGPPSGWGTTPWLNTPMNITDWGSRAVPNVLLVSAFQTKAVWNAAHYSNKKYDRLTKSFIGAIALKDQRKYARQIETLLLHDTPVIIPYFYNYLSAGTKRVKGTSPMRWARCTSATPRSAEPDCDAAGRSLARP